LIKTFKDKETEKVFTREESRKWRSIQKVAQRKLMYLHAATRLDDLKAPPGNRLKKLGGDRKGQYSIRVNDQWRICFIWREGDAYEVEVADYH